MPNETQPSSPPPSDGSAPDGSAADPGGGNGSGPADGHAGGPASGDVGGDAGGPVGDNGGNIVGVAADGLAGGDAADPVGGDAGDPDGGKSRGGAGSSDAISCPGDPSLTGSGPLCVPDEPLPCDAGARPDAVASVGSSTSPQEEASAAAAAAETAAAVRELPVVVGAAEPAAPSAPVASASTAAPTAPAAAAEAPAAVEDESTEEDSTLKRGTNHLSSKYTEEQLMSRHWGMNMEQAKRVKALLRMGVCEEDLAIAERLLKLGTDTSTEAPWTKEEQLLGYTSQQRQRMKALHTLGLTEEALERCRSIMLSSLGPSAFGMDVEQTAKKAARAAQEDWTPEKSGGGVQTLLTMTPFSANGGAMQIGQQLARRMSMPSNGLSFGTGGGAPPPLERRDSRRPSNMDSAGVVHLPSITAGRMKPVLERGAGATGKERVRPLEEETAAVPVARRRDST